jgi:hypothetical protein
MPVEGPDVALRLEAEIPQLVRSWEPWVEVGAGGLVPDEDGVVRLGPWLSTLDIDSPDAYQVVRWRVDHK